MPKATLEFNIPEEGDEFELASSASKLSMALLDIDDWLRSEIKYKDQNQYQPVRDQLWEIINDHGIKGLIF